MGIVKTLFVADVNKDGCVDNLDCAKVLEYDSDSSVLLQQQS